MYRAAIVTTFLLFLISTYASEVIQDQRTVKFDYTLYGDVRDKNELDGITTDAQGNTIMGGPFQNTVIFDYQGNNPKTRTSRNGTDIYITKVNPNNNKTLWFTRYDSGKNDFMYDLTTDKDGNVLISGSVGGEITKRHGVGARPDGRAFVAKLNGRNGNVIWKKVFNFPSGANEIKADSDGNIVATVMGMSSQFKFSRKYNFQGSGMKDAFVVKLKANGALDWVFPILGTGNKQIRAIGINKNKKVIFGLEYIGYASYPSKNPNIYKTMSAGTKNYQGLMGVLSTDGNLLFDRPVFSPGFSNVRGAGADSKGNFYYTGVMTGQTLFGLETVMASRRQSSFLAKVTETGTLKWIRLLHGEGIDRGSELVVTHDDRIVLGNSTSSQTYNVHNKNGKVLQRDISNSNHPATTRAVMTIFNKQGDVIETYSPAYSRGSLAGVMEDSPKDNCLVVQFRYRGSFVHPDGSKRVLDERSDYAIQASKLCK